MIDIFILILWIGTSKTTTLSTLEFTSLEKCMTAGQLAVSTFAIPPVKVKYTCVPK